MIKEEIKIPIFHGTLVMILVDNLEELNEEYDLTFNNTHGAGVFNKTDKDGYIKYYAAFNHDWYYGVIAHEAVHIVNDVFRGIGFKLDVNNDEAQAYFTQWVFEQCEEFLNEHKVMEQEKFLYRVSVGSDILLETEDQVEAMKTFNDLPSGTGQPASKRRSLIRIKTLLEDDEE